MDDETVFVVLEEFLWQEEPVLQVEDVVPQVDDDFNDTSPMGVPALRGSTVADWPPEPPLPADCDLAQGTETNAAPVRNARFYAAVRRPTTSNEDT